VTTDNCKLEIRQILESHAIVLFDGECNLCNACVNSIIANDSRKRFRFAALRSAVGHRLLAQHGLPGSEPSTVVLIEGQRAFTRSTAALRIARSLRRPWRFLFALIAIPSFLRDPLYALIARNRYRWFGRSASCRLTGPELRERFLE